MRRSTNPALAGTTAGDLDETRFRVSINYLRPGGGAAIYVGTWSARTAAAAADKGRSFVSTYLRPASINEVTTSSI